MEQEPSTSDAAKGVKYVVDSLSEIFRYLIPGIMIIGGAYLSHPRCFKHIDWEKQQSVIILALIAIVAGSIWFVFHRYVVQQAVDFYFYLKNVPGGPRIGEKQNSLQGARASDSMAENCFSLYAGAIADHVFLYYKFAKYYPKLGDHIRFRGSSVVLMYITSEAMIIFGIAPSHHSFLRPQFCLPCNPWAEALGLVGFYASICQNKIVRRIEGKVTPPSWLG